MPVPHQLNLRSQHHCGSCGKQFPTTSGVKRHIAHAPACRRALKRAVEDLQPSSVSATLNQELTDVPLRSEDNEHEWPSCEEADAHNALETPLLPTDPPESPRTRIQEVPDDEDLVHWVEKYPGRAGEILEHGGECTYEKWRRESAEAGRSRWHPFASEQEWELGRWLAKNVGQNQLEEFLKLPIIRSVNLTAKSKYLFNQQIDQLSSTIEWIYDQLTITGDRVGEDGQTMTETMELWRRDPIAVVRELIGNPAFRECMSYVPERVFEDDEMNERVIEEMSSADWWWEVQEKLPEGATVAPIILASDSTQLSRFRGDQSAWPVYLTIGNISKSTRRQLSARAMILLAYIPESSFSCFTKATQGIAKHKTFHHCMEKVVEGLIAAGQNGVNMVCADGGVRLVFPIVAAYIADHPEQCLVTDVHQNFCPRGDVDPKERGELNKCRPRDVADTLEALRLHEEGFSPDLFEKQGLYPVYRPFWRNLPFCDIFSCITPDLLHQLHKGVFKDHLVSWCVDLIGEEEVDLEGRPSSGRNDF